MVKKTRKFSTKAKKRRVKWHAAPLKGSFMVIAIIGFLLSIYIVYDYSTNFAVALMLIFTAMFVASLISMTKAPIIDE